MVFMAMRQHDAEQVLFAVFDKFQIRQNNLYPGIFIAGKCDAEVNHQPFALTAIEVDVHANLVRPAKREEQKFIFWVCHAPPSRPA